MWSQSLTSYYCILNLKYLHEISALSKRYFLILTLHSFLLLDQNEKFTTKKIEILQMKQDCLFCILSDFQKSFHFDHFLRSVRHSKSLKLISHINYVETKQVLSFEINYLNEIYENSLTKLKKHWKSLSSDKLHRQICNYCLYLMIRLDLKWKLLMSSEFTFSLTLDKFVFSIRVMFV